MICFQPKLRAQSCSMREGRAGRVWNKVQSHVCLCHSAADDEKQHGDSDSFLAPLNGGHTGALKKGFDHLCQAEKF